MQETVMYDPYGQPYLFNRAGQSLTKSQFGNSFYLAGRPYTRLTGWNSGIYDMRHRFYAADIGRFMQADPKGFKGGGNLYAYAGNNPIDRIDPDGLVFGIPANGQQVTALFNDNGNYTVNEPLGGFMEALAIVDAGGLAGFGLGAVGGLTEEGLTGAGLTAWGWAEGLAAGLTSGLGLAQWGNASMAPGGYVLPGLGYLSGGQWPYSAPPMGFSDYPPSIGEIINGIINGYNQAAQQNGDMQQLSDPNSQLNQLPPGSDTISVPPIIDDGSSIDSSQDGYVGPDYGGTDFGGSSGGFDSGGFDGGGFDGGGGGGRYLEEV